MSETNKEKSDREGSEWDAAFVAAGFAHDVEDAARFRGLMWSLWEDGKTHLPPTVRFNVGRLREVSGGAGNRGDGGIHPDLLERIYSGY